MKWIKNLSIGLVLIGAVDSCIKEPTYSVVPHIELANLVFKKGGIKDGLPSADTLIIELKFRDGDGDLGVSADDAKKPVYQNPFYWGYKPQNLSDVGYGPDKDYILSLGYSLLNYNARKLVEFDTLPDISSCKNWEELRDNTDVVIDTLFITQNLKAFNISLDIYIKNSSGNYEPYDPNALSTIHNCSPNLFRGTFPDLSNDRKNAPLEGTLTFRLLNRGLPGKFGNKTLKMDVTINDRAFHRSNVVEKKTFTLPQITK